MSDLSIAPVESFSMGFSRSWLGQAPGSGRGRTAHRRDGTGHWARPIVESVGYSVVVIVIVVIVVIVVVIVVVVDSEFTW